jgi:hypothetical protein
MKLNRIRTSTATLLVALVLASAGFSAAGCQRQVEVQSGTRTVCTAGEVISDDVKTVRVPANKAGSYRVRTITITCDKHTKLETLYAEAQTALAAGNTTVAASKLAEIVAIDPTYRQAQTQADAIKKGSKPSPDTAPPPSVTPTSTSGGGDGGTGTGTGGTGGTTGLAAWAPAMISGFAADTLQSDALTISREYAPSGSSAAQHLTIVAEQFRTADDAKQGLETQVKQRYPKNAASLKVKGRDAYFGTDGRQLAVLGFTDGSVMVALELQAADSPASLKSLAEQIASQLP